MERQKYFTIEPAAIEQIIRQYEAFAKTVLNVAERLRNEVTSAAMENRPVNKARCAAIVRWHGQVPKQADQWVRQQEGSPAGG